MPSNWLIFDRIRALTKANNIYQAERVLQNQPDLDKLVSGGDFSNFSTSAAILDQTGLQINRLTRYKDLEIMDQTGEISLALDLYADEACLTGDTRIPLLDGTCPTIAELAEREDEYWVYAFDQKRNKYVPAKAGNARVTGENVPIVKVMLDDGSEIKCTADHLFMLNDGSFIEAGDLCPGDSLKPLYKKVRYRGKDGRALFDEQPYPTATGYEYFFNGKNYTSTHRWVYHHFNKDQPEVVHHKDFNSQNNDPTNLDGLTNEEHNIIHCRLGADNPSFNPISWNEVLQVVQDWHGPMSKDRLCEALDVGERVLNRLFREEEITWREFKDRYNRCTHCDDPLVGDKWVCSKCREEYLRNYHQLKLKDQAYRERRCKNKRNHYKTIAKKKCLACREVLDASNFKRNKCSYSPYCNSCRPTVCQKRYLNKSFINHSVVSVEQCGIADKVYDLTVPEYHCFAAGTKSSWVIVHNSLVDPERKHTLVIRARNRRLKRELEEFFFSTLLWDNWCRPAARYLCKYGDLPLEMIPTINRDGISALKFMSVYNFTRVETKFGDLVGFFYQDQLQPEPQFLHPWQVVHMRLTSFENHYHPYGRSILDGGRKAAKQLQLMEDAALVYRLTRAPERRKFTIPVGTIPSHEIPQYMQMISRNFKRQRFYNPSTGTYDERYSPLIQEDDFFLPRRPDGSGPDIDTLPGAENLDQIADIEYFKKKMIAPTKIPFARVGIGEGAGEASEKSLSQSHAEFAKAVQWVQREISTSLTKAAIVHLALRGYSIEDIKGFDISLSATSAMEELYRIETWQTRANVMAGLKDLGWFPKEWIVTRFTDLSPDEIEELKDMESTEEAGGEGGGIPGGLDLPGDVPEGDMDLGMDAAEDLGEPPAGDVPLEGFDYNAERRVLQEIQKASTRKRKMQIINEWRERIGKDVIIENPITNGFDFMLNSNELDGLPKPNSRHPDDLLIEWATDDAEREEVINETYRVLTEGLDLEVEEDSDVITEEDLPPL